MGATHIPTNIQEHSELNSAVMKCREATDTVLGTSRQRDPSDGNFAFARKPRMKPQKTREEIDSLSDWIRSRVAMAQDTMPLTLTDVTTGEEKLEMFLPHEGFPLQNKDRRYVMENITRRWCNRIMHYDDVFRGRSFRMAYLFTRTLAVGEEHPTDHHICDHMEPFNPYIDDGPEQPPQDDQHQQQQQPNAVPQPHDIDRDQLRLDGGDAPHPVSFTQDEELLHTAEFLRECSNEDINPFTDDASDEEDDQQDV